MDMIDHGISFHKFNFFLDAQLTKYLAYLPSSGSEKHFLTILW